MRLKPTTPRAGADQRPSADSRRTEDAALPLAQARNVVTSPLAPSAPSGHAPERSLEHIQVAVRSAPSGSEAMLQQLLEGWGLPASSEDVGQLLRSSPSLGRTLRLFEPAYHEASTDDARLDLVARAYRHHLVNTTPAPGETPLPRVLEDSEVVRLATDYARDVGLGEVTREGREWFVEVPGRGRMPLGKEWKGALSPESSLRQLGAWLNQARFGTPIVVPPLGTLAADATGFDRGNAQLSGHLAKLAYETEPVVRAQLSAWGYDLSTLRWLEDPRTDTQGFVVADKEGNAVVSFRGTASRRDIVTDVQLSRARPEWAGGKARVHRGFEASLDSVWPQVEKALASLPPRGPRSRPVLFTGHSLGGALAELCALRASRAGVVDSSATQVYTLGAPRIGDAALKTLYERELPRTFRLVNEDEEGKRDLVTQVPTRFLGYRHVGHQVDLSPGRVEIHTAARSQALQWHEPAANAALAPGPSDDPENAALEALEAEQLQAVLEQLYTDTERTELINEAWLDAKQASGPGGPGDVDVPGGQRGIITGARLHGSALYLERLGALTVRGLD